jgi:DNA mismatch repair protein MutS2
VPGSSNAFYIAERLGLPAEIVEVARQHQSSQDRDTAELLQQIEESRRNAFEMERDAAVARQAAESAREEYERRAREVADVQRSVRRQAEEEARTVLRRVTERAENILDELRKANRGQRKGVTARKRLTDLRREATQELGTEEQEEQVEPIPAEGFTFRRGDRVRVVTLGLDGDLLENPKDGNVAVQMGAMRATLPLDVLRPVAKPPEPEPKKRSSAASEMAMRKAIHISHELNLRAMRVDEAAPLLDKYVDDAYAAGIHNARIIHGKGTGALRKFVWDTLSNHPIVDSLKLGDESEGGEGVTLITFKE